jgi:uncharacterized protein (TIGR03067 family)
MNAFMSVVLVLGVGLAAEAPAEDAAKKEYTRFEGTWKIVSVEVEGAKQEEGLLKNARIILKGDKFTFKQGDMSTPGTFKVDVTTKPRTIDVTFTGGPDKGQTLHGIYELDGDTYKVCLAMPGKDRPKEFVSKPGSGHVLEVLKREKK